MTVWLSRVRLQAWRSLGRRRPILAGSSSWLLAAGRLLQIGSSPVAWRCSRLSTTLASMGMLVERLLLVRGIGVSAVAWGRSLLTTTLACHSAL